MDEALCNDCGIPVDPDTDYLNYVGMCVPAEQTGNFCLTCMRDRLHYLREQKVPKPVTDPPPPPTRRCCL